MATEKEYDDEIAPLLLQVATRCSELGMSLIARVEWAPGEVGITQKNIADASSGQKLTALAAHSAGNFDLLAIAAKKRFDCSQSVVLSRL